MEEGDALKNNVITPDEDPLMADSAEKWNGSVSEVGENEGKVRVHCAEA